MSEVNIDEEKYAQGLNFASKLIQRKLEAKGLNTPSQSEYKQVEENILTGNLDDEEEEYNSSDYEDEPEYTEEDEVLINGTQEEADIKCDEKANECFHKTPKGYKTSEPITISDIRKVIEETMKNITPAELFMNKFGYKTAFNSPNHDKEAAKEAESKPDIMYGTNVYTINGESKECSEVVFGLDMSKYTSRYKAGDVEGNMNLLTDIISLEVIKNFPKIYSIAVCDYCLLINNTSFMPSIENTDAKFPMDSYAYIKNGSIAPFVDWKRVFKHANNTCVSISFDSTDFYLTYVGDALGLGRKIGVSTVFKQLNNLENFYLENKMITREDLYSPKSADIKKTLAVKKRNFHLFDGYQFNACKGTQAIQNFTIGNLSTYARNRGNKGLIHYTAGVLVRAGLAVGGIGFNLTTHIISGVTKGIKSLFTQPEEDTSN